MVRYSSAQYDWSIAKDRADRQETSCKFILPKRLVRLAVLRNRIKRIIRHSENKQACCFFKIKVSVTKTNCEMLVKKIRNSLKNCTAEKNDISTKD